MRRIKTHQFQHNQMWEARGTWCVSKRKDIEAK